MYKKEDVLCFDLNICWTDITLNNVIGKERESAKVNDKFLGTGSCPTQWTGTVYGVQCWTWYFQAV